MTVEGQDVAMSLLRPQVAQRDGPPIQPRVALTEVVEARQQPVVTHVPEPTWVCDSSPATESLGDPANPRLGATYLPRLAWVRADLEPLLAGQLSRVIAAWAA
jgi:hypothetical protein